MGARVREVGPRKKLHAEFDSVQDVYRVIDKLNWVPKQGESSNTRNNGGGAFYHFKDLAECQDVFRNHPERVVAFDPNDEKLVREDSIGKEVRFDITGDFLDIDKFLEGTPEVFGNAVMGNPKNIFCTINILTVYVSYTDVEYLIQRQRRIARLVDWLEAQNIRCQIVGTCDSECIYFSTVVKQFADPLDINDLAVVSHPEWLRRIIFLAIEQSKTFSYGYGSAIEYDRKMIGYTPVPEDGMYVYVGGYIPHKGDKNKTAIDRLNEEFDALEDKIQGLIDEGLTFNDEPFVIAGRTMDW